MSDAILFDKQKEWEDFGSAVFEESLINVLTSASTASQIPTVTLFEETKRSLSYSNLDGAVSSIVVLDVLVAEAADNPVSKDYDADSLDETVREIVAKYQTRARENDCHLTGQYISTDNKVTGALLRIYRNQDFVCKGHPELLHGKPIGMFHCDKCGELQQAGCFHLPKEETQNG